MSFLIRAALTIGALSYLAAHRDPPVDGTALAALPSSVSRLAATWETLPEEARDRAVRDGTAELTRRISSAVLISRDTLADADRRPAWRGGDGR